VAVRLSGRTERASETHTPHPHRSKDGDRCLVTRFTHHRSSLSLPSQLFGAWASGPSAPLAELVPSLLINIKPAYVADHALAM